MPDWDRDYNGIPDLVQFAPPVDSTSPKPGEVREIVLPSGRRLLQTYSPTGDINYDGSPVYDWLNEGSYFVPSERGGGGGASSADAAASRRLSAMTSALSSFLQAQSLADARKLAASEQFQKMAAFAVPEGTTIMPGWEQGGPMHRLAAVRGYKTFTPRPVQTQRVDPSKLAEAGVIPPEVMEMINQVRGAA